MNDGLLSAFLNTTDVSHDFGVSIFRKGHLSLPKHTILRRRRLHC